MISTAVVIGVVTEVGKDLGTAVAKEFAKKVVAGIAAKQVVNRKSKQHDGGRKRGGKA